MKFIPDVLDHASKTPQRESCGLVVNFKGKPKYIPCRNIHKENDAFALHPLDVERAKKQGDIIYVVHTHNNIPCTPSERDLRELEKQVIKAPWLIVSYPSGEFVTVTPKNYQEPLIGREFEHGVNDCYTLIQRYYNQVLNVALPEYKREDKWWEGDDVDFYDELHEHYGFQKVPFTDIKEHDIIIMKLGNGKNNHSAVYLGNMQILHHTPNRLSCRENLNGYWLSIMQYVLRYKYA